MDRLNVRETSKVPGIESQNSPDAMHAHRCDQSGIVNLNARDAMCHKQFPPFLMDQQTIGE